MTHHLRIPFLLIIVLMLPLLQSCQIVADEEVTSSPILTESPAPNAKYCGDGICDGPENEGNCPEDCQAEEVPTGTAPPSVDQSESPCGDGVCDEAEQQDPALCPQDCSKGVEPPTSGMGEPPAVAFPDYEPPINIVLILHSDPDMPIESFTFQATDRDYQRTKEGIELLLVEAAQHDLQFTALYNGWYPMEAIQVGELSQFQALLDAGHEIGTHAHRLTYDPNQDLWTAHVEDLSFYGRPNYDHHLARQTWEDAFKPVEDVLKAISAADQNETMSTRSFIFSEEEGFMQEYGFTIAAGDRAELSTNYFGHMVWNPFRPAADDEIGHELLEDQTASFITIDHYAQIGSHEVSHAVDLTIPQMQRRFLMLYSEWLQRVRTGAEDRVWTFGFVYHPNYTDRYMADLSQFLDWLDTYFIGVTTPEGYTIARYATLGELAREFEAWEDAHPGASSFNYQRGDPYPYSFPTIAVKLEGASFEGFLDLGQDITAFQYTTDAGPIYLTWSSNGEMDLDFSGILSGSVRCTDMAGQEVLQDAAAIPLAEDPLLIEP